MRPSKQGQALPSLSNFHPILQHTPPPIVRLPNPENKFKMLKKTFLSSKTKLRQLIQRQAETSYQLKRKINVLPDKSASTSEYLISLKKAYNSMSNLVTRKENGTKKFKQDIEKMNKDIYDYKQGIKNERDNLEQLSHNCEQAKEKQQTTAMQSKVLEHILDRMKKDQIYTQKRVDQLQSRLQKIKNQLKVSQKKKTQLQESRKIYSDITKQIKKVYADQTSKRNQDLFYYQNKLKTIKLVSQREEEQLRINKQIQGLATSHLNDANTLKWKKLLFVQLVVRNMLKFKISNLEKKYAAIKNAFRIIRTKTPIDDPKRIFSGFQQLQNTTLDLVENIKFLENKQKQLELEKRQLQSDYQHEQEQYYQVLQSKENVDQFQQVLLSRKAKGLSSKCLNIQLMEKKLSLWLCEHKNKFNILDAKQKAEINLPFQSQKLCQNFNDFCDYLIQKHKTLRESRISDELNLSQLHSLENTIYGAVRKKQNDQQNSEMQAIHKIKYKF